MKERTPPVQAAQSPIHRPFAAVRRSIDSARNLSAYTLFLAARARCNSRCALMNPPTYREEAEQDWRRLEREGRTGRPGEEPWRSKTAAWSFMGSLRSFAESRGWMRRVVRSRHPHSAELHQNRTL